MMSRQLSHQPTRRWSVEGFEMFWRNPANPQLVAYTLLPEVAGYWPQATEALKGVEAYVAGIEAFVALVPELSGKVEDFALGDDIAFVRWSATGRVPVGPSVITGVDRILLRDGFVLENRIHSDHPIFGQL